LTTHFARRIVLWVLAVGMAWAPASAATQDDNAQAQARSRFMLEQMRAYRLAVQSRDGDDAARSLNTLRLPAKPMTSLELLESLKGRSPLLPARQTVDSSVEQSIKTVFRQLLNGPSSCCYCTDGSTCNDGLFCDGVELCQSGVCVYGAPPCVDGDPCTTDVCTENTDTCSHQPVPPPAEVASLNMGRSAPASPVATLAWSSVSGATAYNVYRGASKALGDLSCFTTGVIGTSSSDDGAVPAQAFYYLVTSTACGESGLGTGQPSPRPLPPGCP